MITRESVQAADGMSFPGISFQKNALKPIFDLQKVYYYRVFIEVTKAHVVMLREQDLMTEDECALILSTMLDLEKLPIEESEYNTAYEDLFCLFEKELENLIGSDLAGKVHTARSRNDICVGEFRMVLREQLVRLAKNSISSENHCCIWQERIWRQLCRCILTRSRHSRPLWGIIYCLWQMSCSGISSD